MVLSTEWAQVEIIDLVNDGNGLGFMLVGGRSTGVVIKALIPGSVAERDGRLQSGDHVLQIGDVNLRGFSSEQVATVLRQSGQQVRLIVARPVEPTSPDYQALASHAPIIPTKLLTDPDELDRTLLQTAGYTSGAFLQPGTVGVGVGVAVGVGAAIAEPPPSRRGLCQTHIEVVAVNNNNNSNSNGATLLSEFDALGGGSIEAVTAVPTLGVALPAMPTPASTGRDGTDGCQLPASVLIATRELVESVDPAVAVEPQQSQQQQQQQQQQYPSPSTIAEPPETPETETYEVELRKNVYGLGITVAGYVCEEEDLSGIFVKSIIEGSAAEMSGRIAINDRIVAVDGRSLAGVSNHQAVEILRNTDIAVRLMLERFLRGRKYEHLQVALIDPVTPHCHSNGVGVGVGVVGGGQPAIGEAAKLHRVGVNVASVATSLHHHHSSSAGLLSQYGDGLMVTSQSQQQLILAHCLASQCPSQCQSQRCSIVQSPSVTTLSICPARSDADSMVTECGGIEPELESGTTFDSNVFTLGDNGAEQSYSDEDPEQEEENHRRENNDGDDGDDVDIDVDVDVDDEDIDGRGRADDVNGNGSEHRTVKKPAGEPVTAAPGGGEQGHSDHSCDTVTSRDVTTTQEQPTRAGAPLDGTVERWSREVPHSQIVVADIRKLAGLGISLEGTVEVEAGVEVRPHHYIRSILEDGPVGRDGSLKPGDELLQVNEHRLQGLRHIEVVKILKELPVQVRVICARGSSPPTVINTSRNAEAFEARSLLAGGLQSLQCLQGILTKAQSESSLYTSSTATLTDQQRSKSVEQVSGLALWTNEVLYCDIEKTERGFGFSILDYQDPLDTDGTVIVVRGLIPGGSAEATNFIFPGDRLVSVNGQSLQGATLDQAVSTLKAIPLGTARIGLCRPLSTSDNNLSSSPDTPTT